MRWENSKKWNSLINHHKTGKIGENNILAKYYLQFINAFNTHYKQFIEKLQNHYSIHYDQKNKYYFSFSMKNFWRDLFKYTWWIRETLRGVVGFTNNVYL